LDKIWSNGLSLAQFCSPDGFSDNHIAAFERLLPCLALAIKSVSLPRMTGTLMQTYLGRDAGQRVLSGRILRGVRPLRGGLAPWQARRATEILTINLDGSVPLKEVAKECHLSMSHFSHAFRVTMGVAPHKWLLTRRVEVAKEKLRDSRLPL
jgi:Bacterial regulatory helix-turn-helix proteins, AraC family